LPLRTTFALAHEVGLDGVELVLGPEVLLRGTAYVRHLSCAYQLPVLSVHPPIVPYPGMGHPQHVVQRLIPLARGVDCSLVVLHTPKVKSTQDAQWVEFVEALSAQSTWPAVRVSVENSGLHRPSDADFVLHDVHRLRTFVEHYDLPVTFDTAHAGTTMIPLLESFAVLNGRVVNIHFSDLVRRHVFLDWKPLHTLVLHHQMPGQGVLPLEALLYTLLDSGYAGNLTLELSPVAVRAWSLTQVRNNLSQAMDYVRNVESEWRQARVSMTKNRDTENTDSRPV